jgi:transcription elongation GreA/GreB family factor
MSIDVPSIRSISRAGREAMESALRSLAATRPAIVAELAANARAHGYADHAAAHARLADLDARIGGLGRRIAETRIVETDEKRSVETIGFGVVAELLFEDGRRLRLRLVGADEAEPAMGTVSVEAPLAKAIIGLRIGDVAEWKGNPKIIGIG